MQKIVVLSFEKHEDKEKCTHYAVRVQDEEEAIPLIKLEKDQQLDSISRDSHEFSKIVHWLRHAFARAKSAYPRTKVVNYRTVFNKEYFTTGKITTEKQGKDKKYLLSSQKNHVEYFEDEIRFFSNIFDFIDAFK